MKKQNLKRIITIGLIAVSILIITPTKASATWKQENGEWLYTEDQKNVTGWKYINENRYYFDRYGNMKTGWIHDNGKWYFANRAGVMQTGKVVINNKEYPFAATGEELRPNGTVDIETYSPSVGKIEIDREDIIERVSDDVRSDNYFRDKSYYEKNIGAIDHGTHIMTFKGLKEGSTKVTIKTGRDMNRAGYDGTIYLITVDKDLNISISKLN